PRDVEAHLLTDLLEAGRAGDVDLGDVVADEVESDEQQPARGERRRERLADLAIARRQRPRDAGAAGGEVAAELAGLRDAREAVRHDFAADQQDALVAFADLGDEAL